MDGIVIVDKPEGWTSQDVTAKLRGVFGTRRIGHGGTLDPMATGVLPVFVGRATRAVEFFEHAEKTYEAVLQLGIATDTEDITGAVVAEKEYGITDPNVLAAIRCHTTGKVGMLPLDMIVFLSDKIEPSRRSYPALEEVRRLAPESLPAAMSHSLRSTLDYVKSQKGVPHPATQQVADWLDRLMAQQRSNEDE